MCGRYATSRSSAELGALFDAVDETEGELAPAYNLAPTDLAPLVRVSARAGRVLSAARWGLVPSWAKDPRAGARMINARAETITDSRAYARSFAERRCLIPADGWFEWRASAADTGDRRRAKQAYFMTPTDGSVLAFGGVWTAWHGGGTTDSLLTFSVVTTAAVGDLALVHDRMPLVLPPDRWLCWLGLSQLGPDSGARVTDDDLLATPPAEFVAGLEIRPVGPAVGDVHSDGPALLTRVPASSLTDPVELKLF